MPSFVPPVPSIFSSSGGANAYRGYKVAQTLLPPKAILSATPVEMLPDLLDSVNVRGQQIVKDGMEYAAPVLQLPAETKNTIQRLFYQHMADPVEAFEQSLSAAAPEAMPQVGILRDMMEQIRERYVTDGRLRPEQRFTNYFPVVRENRVATRDGIKMVEVGDSYFPIPLENMIKARDPWFTKTRTIQNPEDFPQRVSLDDTLNLYLRQYARHVSISESQDEISQMLGRVPNELGDYVADYVNGWLGHPSAGRRMSEVGRLWREYQFIRTIGGNFLTPIVNSFQRINTFAVTGTGPFMRAFEDMKNPDMLRTAIRAGVSPDYVFGKAGLDDIVGGSGISRTMATMRDTLGQLFSTSEQGNRLHAFFAGMRLAEERGITDPAAQMAMGKEVMNTTQFIHSSANTPRFMRGDLGRTLGQFQSFRINQTHFMARMIDDARAGVMRGDFSAAAPLLRFLGPTVLLGGVPSLMPWDWGDPKETDDLLKKAMRIQGIPELLFGISLRNQFGLGTVGADDLNSFLFYLPGPTAGFIQTLVGAGTGTSAGHGLDLTDAGRDLSLQERVGAGLQALPAGIQANRLVSMLRLVQNSGEFRKGIDLSQVLGMQPAQGDLLSGHAASLEQQLMGGVGFALPERDRERKQLNAQDKMKNEFDVVQNKYGMYMAAGRPEDAVKVIQDFNHRWEDELRGGAVHGSDTATRAAVKRTLTPPGKRRLAPVQLRGAAPFLDEDGS